MAVLSSPDIEESVFKMAVEPCIKRSIEKYVTDSGELLNDSFDKSTAMSC